MKVELVRAQAEANTYRVELEKVASEKSNAKMRLAKWNEATIDVSTPL